MACKVVFYDWHSFKTFHLPCCLKDYSVDVSNAWDMSWIYDVKFTNLLHYSSTNWIACVSISSAKCSAVMIHMQFHPSLPIQISFQTVFSFGTFINTRWVDVIMASFRYERYVHRIVKNYFKLQVYYSIDFILCILMCIWHCTKGDE